MADCSKLTAGIAFDCDTTIKVGTEDTLCIFNWDELDTDSSNLDLIASTKIVTFTTIEDPLNAPALYNGYQFGGSNNSNESNDTNVLEGFNKNKFEHNVTFRIFTDNEEVPEIKKQLANGRFVAVLFTRNKLVRVYGWDVGVVCTVTQADKENEGLIVVTMANPENEYQVTPPKTYVADGIKTFAELKADILALTV
jgi:hypothetical protein